MHCTSYRLVSFIPRAIVILSKKKKNSKSLCNGQWQNIMGSKNMITIYDKNKH